MNVSLHHTLITMIEAMLPPYSKGKALHIALHLDLEHNINADIDRSPNTNCDYYRKNTIRIYANLHLVLHRPMGRIRGLSMLGNTPFLDTCEGPLLFTEFGHHDSEWREGLKRVIHKVEDLLMKNLQEQYLQRTGLSDKEALHLSVVRDCRFGFCGAKGLQLIDTELITKGAFDEADTHEFTMTLSHEEQPDNWPRKTTHTLTQTI